MALHCCTAHATHPDGHMALALAAAQIDAQTATQRRVQPDTPAATLGLMYFTAAYAAQAEALLAEAQTRWPGVQWSGCVGHGVLANGVEYVDEPALVLMLLNLPAEQFALFSGRQPLPPAERAHTALVHADPRTPDLPELVAELAGRTATGYLFGGLASGGQRWLHLANGVVEGGLSGVAFGPEVALVSRVTQGCQPAGPARVVTRVVDNVLLTLDDQPALELLLSDTGLSMDRPQQALRGLRETLVGLTDGRDDVLARGGQFGSDTRVRHLVGIDPGRSGVAIAEAPQVGDQVSFCRRHAEAARRDLVRICAEIRDELDADLPEPSLAGTAGADPGQAGRPTSGTPRGGGRIAAAVYISCSGRGGPHFGAPSAEAQILQHALGDVPLVGFFAGGEIARHHLYGYTGVLTVLVQH